jgi:hypothetical protein
MYSGQCGLMKGCLYAAAALVGSRPENLHPVLREGGCGRHSVAALVAETKRFFNNSSRTVQGTDLAAMYS